MTRRDLLPGVAPDSDSPAVAVDSYRAIRRARIHAVARDVANFLLLAGVDYFFLRWPNAHVPTFDRSTSVLILAVLNLVVITHIMLSRVVPRMTAKRIAATWCLRERARFFQADNRPYKVAVRSRRSRNTSTSTAPAITTQKILRSFESVT